MKLWGGRRRLCFSGWLLAALLVVGVNGYRLLALENQQMVGHSPTIKALRANLAQWEKAALAQSWSPDGDRLNALPIRYSAPRPQDTAVAPPAEADSAAVETPAAMPIPALIGIVQSMDRRGRQTQWALLDGQVRRAGDRVGDFTVERVTPDGVVLSRGGHQWHLDSPKPSYSEDLGN